MRWKLIKVFEKEFLIPKNFLGSTCRIVTSWFKYASCTLDSF